MARLRTFTSWLVLALALLASGCATTRTYVADEQAVEALEPPSEAQRAYRVFLIGDAGDPNLGHDPVLHHLGAAFEAAGEQSAVVFLGDNVYCCGIPDSAAATRALAERRLAAQLQAVQPGRGRIFVIPGNHDWSHSRPDGLQRVRNQEAFVEHYLDRGNVFLPDSGFPGPIEVELADGLVLVLIDTQWWLHPYGKPYGDTGEYDLDEDGDFLLEMEDVVRRHDDERLLVAGHHPLISNGPHGGYLPVKDHLFPLTHLARWAYLPLPLIGSFYPLSVRLVGGRQDLAHPRYRSLRTGLTRLFERHESLVYAAGHDHSLQHHPRNQQHYLVSGAGSRPHAAAPGRGADFVAGTGGYLVLDYYDDGQLWMTAWTFDEDTPDGTSAYRAQLFGPSRERVDPGLPAAKASYPDYRDSTVTVAANPDYLAGSLKSFILGSHNRAAWAVPVTVPVLDLGREAGGLTPVKRGGGMQTVSLRLQGADGKEYVLRSIDKDPSQTVPEALQGTLATEIVQDQIASIHPYGAFIIPKLAEAAGVYHTHPRLVFVPDDPRLGIYRETFGNQLMMLENRPDGDMSDAPNYGHAENVIGTSKLYEEIDDDNDHRVDQQAFVRARLFDMWLSDWDRHRDQWRWAAFEPYELDPLLEGEAREQGKIYRPIPRDRDWAFNRMDGLVSAIRYIDPKFQDFKEDYGDLRGLTKNGLEQDRRFTNAVTREEWIAIAEDLQQRLTDDVIEKAVQDWPESVVALDGARVTRVLKARRAQIAEVAERYYELLARVVDVVGSNKHERFEVTTLADGAVEVVMHKTTSEGTIRDELYRRVFLPNETRELRLYGQGGNDQFIVQGPSADAIRIVVVGGSGADRFVDEVASGSARFMHVYDTIEENTFEAGDHMRLRTSTDPLVNTYDPLEYRHNSRQPLFYFGSNQRDGIFVGGGIQFIGHGFRKVPYAHSHSIKANVAVRTWAFNVVYAGQYVDVLDRWDVGLNAEVLSPNNVRNYYGLGNETSRSDRDARYYEARLTQLRARPALMYALADDVWLELGPTMQFTRVREDRDRFIADPQAGVAATTFDDQWVVGVEALAHLTTVDDAVNPTQGVRWEGAAEANLGVRNSDASYSRLTSELAVYLSPSLSPQVTVALRAGGAHTMGTFPFYSANTLGEDDNLRGYRSTRFAGRSSLYTNAELRVQLLSFSTYFAIGRLGVLGFVDNGRVWTDGEHSKVWHQGYGGGIWASLFDLAVVSTAVGVSEEQASFTLRLGFLY